MSSSFFAASRRSACTAVSAVAAVFAVLARADPVQRGAQALADHLHLVDVRRLSSAAAGCFRRTRRPAARLQPRPRAARSARFIPASLQRRQLPRPYPGRRPLGRRGYTRRDGPGAGPSARVRAAAQAAAAAHRRDRPGRRRGARRRAREAQHQEGLEGLGARARDPLLRPDDARGAGHARQGRGALLEGDPARPDRPERPVGRRGLRLPEPRADRGRAARAAPASRSRPSRPRSRPARARSTSSCATSRTRSRSAPTRSTW